MVLSFGNLGGLRLGPQPRRTLSPASVHDVRNVAAIRVIPKDVLNSPILSHLFALGVEVPGAHLDQE